MARDAARISACPLSRKGIRLGPVTGTSLRSTPRSSASIFATVASYPSGSFDCADCHVPALTTNNVVLKEPSDNADYCDANDVFPADQSADIAQHVFDITTDVPDNQIEFGSVVRRIGNFGTNGNGRAIVRIYSDLKQHDMWLGIAENIDEVGNGASVWMKKELWGLRNTAHYLHDGCATTIEKAIQAHGGAAANSAANFSSMSVADRTSMLTFLKNLVLFFPADAKE